MATATARLSSTTGDGDSLASSAYRAATRGQSVSAAPAAAECSAAICAWSWYAPGRRSARARSSTRTPSAIRSLSQRERSWCSSSTISPSLPVRAARRESWKSMSASRPSASGSSGISTATTLARRIASSHSSPRTSASPPLAE